MAVIGDELLLCGTNKQVLRVASRITKYASFRNMFELESLISCLPGIVSIKDGVHVYRAFYSEEQEQECGVICIELL